MDLTAYYISLLEEFRCVSEAEKEFRRQMDDDPGLKAEYEVWCEENELSTRTGLTEFGTEYISERESKWEVLNDYDD